MDEHFVNYDMVSLNRARHKESGLPGDSFFVFEKDVGCEPAA